MTTGKLLATAGILLALVSLSFIPAAAQSQATRAFLWTQTGGMQDIGTLPGFSDSSAYGINSGGTIVGNDLDDTSGVQTAFRWSQSTGSVRLQGLGTVTSTASAVNSSGQVTGTFYSPNGTPHAFFWSPKSGAVDVGTLGGNFAVANAVNKSGTVAGWSATPDGSQHAFLWSQGGGMQDLGVLPGGMNSGAYAVNDSGDVVGYSQNNDGVNLAVIWRNGKIRSLGVLGRFGKNTSSQALGINKVGEVVAPPPPRRGRATPFSGPRVRACKT